jgi:peroxiredoxin
MKKLRRRKALTFPFFLFLALAFGSLSLLPEIGRAGGAPMAIGTKLETFTLADTDGKQRKFDDLKGKKGTILVFLSTKCPFVNQFYKDRIGQMAKDFGSNGVNVVGINSNITENEKAADIKTNAEEKGFAFPILIDQKSVIAAKLGATVTPEIYFFNAENKLVYRGAIDNDKSGENITANYLKDAVDAVVAGKPVTKAETKGIGCGIKTPESMNMK